jgi:hypothetical protein
MRTWLENSWLPSHPAQVVRYEELRENPPHAILGISSTAYLSSLDEFRLSAGYAEQAPNRDILVWLQNHGEHSRHIALTATALHTAPASAAWVLRHFGRWIREFAIIPAGRSGEDLPIYDIDKGSWLARLGASAVLVDDSPQNLAAAAAVGATPLRWPRPWNGGGTGVAETLHKLTEIVDAGDAP